MRARLGRVLTVCWLVLLGAHAWIGGRVARASLGAHRRLPSGPDATSDLWLKRIKVGATTAEVQTLLARIPQRQDIILLAPRAGRTEYPPWPFLSYVAWPHSMWVYNCDETVTQPYIVGPDPTRVPWLLYFDIKPPRALRRVGVAAERHRRRSAKPVTVS